MPPLLSLIYHRIGCKGKTTHEAKKMKAVLLTGFGGYDKLEYRQDVAIPEPQEDEALVKVSASKRFQKKAIFWQARNSPIKHLTLSKAAGLVYQRRPKDLK